MDLETQEQLGLYILFGIYNLMLWPGLFFFIVRRDKEPIKSRGFNLAVIQMLMGLVLLLFSIIPNSVSCFFRPAALLLIVPFVCVPYVIRGAVLYHRYVLHNGMKIWAGRHKSTSLSSVDADAEMFLKSLSSHGSGSKGGDSRNGTGNGSEHEEGSQTGSNRKGDKDKKKEGKSTVSKREEVRMSTVLMPQEVNNSTSSDASSPADPSVHENPTAAENAAAAGENSARNPLFPEENRKQDFGLDLKLDQKFIWAVKSKKFFHDRFLIPLCFLLGLPFIIVIILLFFFDEFVHPESVRNDFTISVHNRCLTHGYVAYLLVQFGVAAPAITYVAYLLLGVKEAFKVRFELLGVFIFGSMGTIGCLISIFYPDMPPVLNYAFFGCVGTNTYCFITLVYPVIQSYKFEKIERKEKPESDDEQRIDRRPSNAGNSGGGARTHESNGAPKEKKKSSRTSRSTDDDILRVIFEEPELLKGFEEFAVSTWCMENVLFYKRVQQFKNSAESKLPDQGKKIWTYHFERGCDFEVNVDAPVREKIMEMVNQGKFERDMFHEAEKIVFTMLRYNIYPLWKASSSYKDILEKLGSPDILSVRARRKNIPPKKPETV